MCSFSVAINLALIAQNKREELIYEIPNTRVFYGDWRAGLLLRAKKLKEMKNEIAN